MKSIKKVSVWCIGVLLCLFLSIMDVEAEELYFNVSPLNGGVPSFNTSKDISGYGLNEDSILNSRVVDKDVKGRGYSKNKNISKLNTRRSTDDYGITLSYVTDYLTQGNTYKLYSIDLDAGNYLQASLNVPNDASVDYDLVLYDSNLSMLKYSNQIPVSYNGSIPIEESLGYIAQSDETVYIAVFLFSNNSNSLTYTLNLAVSDINEDSSETDDNVNECIDTQLNYANYMENRIINSPIDYDWFKFSVIDDEVYYSKIRLNILYNGAHANDCKFDLYQNLASGTGNYALYKLVSGNGGEITLDPGEYYLRVSTTDDINSFDINNAITSYCIEIGPETPMTNITITSLTGPNAVNDIEYDFGYLTRIDEMDPSYVEVSGRATYTDEFNIAHGANNILIQGLVDNTSWDILNQPSLRWSFGEARTSFGGYFTIRIPLQSGCGYWLYHNGISIHHYDHMRIEVKNKFNSSPNSDRYFYLLKVSDWLNNI